MAGEKEDREQILDILVAVTHTRLPSLLGT